MAAPYLHFLYPPLFRVVESPAVVRSASHFKSSVSRRKLHASISRGQDTFVQRYGPAAEQPPPAIMTKAQAEQMKKPPEKEKLGPREAKSWKEFERAAEPQKPKAEDSPALTPDGVPQVLDVDPNPQPSSTDPKVLEAEAKRLQEKALAAQNKPGPLDKVLQMQAPPGTDISTGEGQTSSKPPHLHAPPYVHHFDSFGIVKDLEKGGFQLNQAETLMKVVRGLLAVNLYVAKEGMVSKSDRENETYLFLAACSELRTETANTRRAAASKQRTERAHLQHEVDILSQRITQETLALKDELRGVFNDRKMAVRTEQRGMETQLQELNYKITVALNSDTKGEVEGLRWVLTRRAAITIGVMAFLILGSLRYATYKTHLEEKLAASGPASGRTSSAAVSPASTYTTPSREMATQTEGDSAALVGANLDSGLG